MEAGELPTTNEKADLEQDGSTLESRLSNWVEQSPELPGAKMARGQIAAELKRDLSTPEGSLEILRTEVQKLTATNAEYAKAKLQSEPVLSKQHSEDSTIFTEVSKNGEGELVAREVRRVGETTSTISEARIAPDGSTRLTLTYSDERYTSNNANPNIVNESKFPRGTARTFNLLVDSTKPPSLISRIAGALT